VLNDLDYPDKSLIDDIASGFKLNGWMPRSMFSASRQEASHVNGDLKDLSKALNATTYRNTSVRLLLTLKLQLGRKLRRRCKKIGLV
jgi:hypothetical protein